MLCFLDIKATVVRTNKQEGNTVFKWMTKKQMMNHYHDEDVVNALIARKKLENEYRPHPELPDVAEATLYRSGRLAAFDCCQPRLEASLRNTCGRKSLLGSAFCAPAGAWLRCPIRRRTARISPWLCTGLRRKQYGTATQHSDRQQA